MNNRNPYITEDGNPILRQSVVAFLDILGYKELSRKEPTSSKLLISLRDALRNSYRPINPDSGASIGSQRYWMAKTFTDNIAIGFPIIFGDALITMILGRLGEFQLQMAIAGFFIRGAVSVDKLYMDDHIVFGPALNEAYDAERKLARDPRIVLTDSAKKVICINELPGVTEPEHHQYDMWLEDPDKQLFLNYLYGVVEFERDMGYPATEYLEIHRKHICDRLKSFTAKPRVWAKYYWCAMYHNFFCMGRDDFDAFKINMESFQSQPQRVSSS